MKLAEALMVRSDAVKKLASLRERIVNNAVVQEGDAPHEDPLVLLKQADAVLDEIEGLAAKINAANQANTLADGRTLSQAIARRDKLAQRHALLHSAISGSHREPDRYSMSEIRWVATLDIALLQKQSEDLAKQIRELNAQIQETNWRVDLE